jgi:hypothetical protein
MINRILFILLIVSSLFIFSNVNISLAYDFITDSGLVDTGYEAGYDTDTVGKEGAESFLNSRIGLIISTALSFLGVIFLILMIYGGFLWMTAKGNEQQVEKAKTLITAAVIGLIIVISAYAISYFVIKNLGDKVLLE